MVQDSLHVAKCAMSIFYLGYQNKTSPLVRRMSITPSPLLALGLIYLPKGEDSNLCLPTHPSVAFLNLSKRPQGGLRVGCAKGWQLFVVPG